MKKRVFIIMILLLVGGTSITAFLLWKNQYKNLCAYTEKLLKIKWSGCIESVEGDADKGAVHVKLEVKAGYEEEVLSIVQNRFGESLDIERNRLSYQRHAFAAEIENSDILYVSWIGLSHGLLQRCKCFRMVYIYVVYNEKGQMYLYVIDELG